MTKRADQLKFFLCDSCAAVHIGLFRNGRMFAEAIPVDPVAVLGELKQAIDKSNARQGGATGLKH